VRSPHPRSSVSYTCNVISAWPIHWRLLSLLSFLRIGNHNTVGVYVLQLVTCVHSDRTDQKKKTGYICSLDSWDWSKERNTFHVTNPLLVSLTRLIQTNSSCVWFVLHHSSFVMWSTQFDLRSVLIILLGIYYFYQLLPVSQWALTSNSSPDCTINQNTQILIQSQAERFKIVNTTPFISSRVVYTTH